MRRTTSVAAAGLAVCLAAVLAAPAAAAPGTGPTRRVSVSNADRQAADGGVRPAVSGDGRFVAFYSNDRLTASDRDDVGDLFLRDRATRRTQLVTVVDFATLPNAPAVNGDGSRVVFEAGNQIYLWQRENGLTSLISSRAPGEAADAYHSYASISGDGRYVVYDSRDANVNLGRIYLRDLQRSTVVRLDLGPGGSPSAGGALHPQISADGSAVSFPSTASDLVPGDTNGRQDVFLWRRSTGTVERVSVGAAGLQANGPSGGSDLIGQAVSDGGRYVAFRSNASNLVAGDTPSTPDVFLRDVESGSTVRVSQAADGSPALAGSREAGISADGRYVVFVSGASNLSPGDSRGVLQVHVWDRTTATSVLASVSGGGIAGNRDSDVPRISSDGHTVVYESLASNLAYRDTNAVRDVFATTLTD